MFQESGQVKMTFKGHSDYLHSIVARNSTNQIITGSEDGTARIWGKNLAFFNFQGLWQKVVQKNNFPSKKLLFSFIVSMFLSLTTTSLC